MSSIPALASLLLRILITTRRTQSTNLIPPRIKHLPTYRPLLLNQVPPSVIITLFNAKSRIKPAMSATEEVRVCLDAHCSRDACKRRFERKCMSEQARWLRSSAYSVNVNNQVSVMLVARLGIRCSSLEKSHRQVRNDYNYNTLNK
jgi:hypothetical protein